MTAFILEIVQMFMELIFIKLISVVIGYNSL